MMNESRINTAESAELNKNIADMELRLLSLQTNVSGLDCKVESLSNSVYSIEEKLNKTEAMVAVLSVMTEKMIAVLSVATTIIAALVVNLYLK